MVRFTPSSALTPGKVLPIPFISSSTRPWFCVVIVPPSLAMRELVDRDGSDHQDAGDEHLIGRLDAEQLEAIAEDPDDQGADEGADDAAAATEEAGAAEHDGGDAVQVGRLPGLRIADAGAGDLEYRCDAVGQPCEGVDAQEDPSRV